MILIIAQIIFLATAIGLSVLILLQQSKGAGIGASFGAGASGTVFGARGAGSFLYKLTRILAVIFCKIISLKRKIQQQVLTCPLAIVIIAPLLLMPVFLWKAISNKDCF